MSNPQGAHLTDALCALTIGLLVVVVSLQAAGAPLERPSVDYQVDTPAANDRWQLVTVDRTQNKSKVDVHVP